MIDRLTWLLLAAAVGLGVVDIAYFIMLQLGTRILLTMLGGL